MRELKIRLKRNKRNQENWGTHTYWLYEINKSNGIKIATSHINSHVELKKSEIQKVYQEVANHHHDISIVQEVYGYIVDFFLDKKETNIITHENQLNEIIEYIKESNK